MFRDMFVVLLMLATSACNAPHRGGTQPPVSALSESPTDIATPAPATPAPPEAQSTPAPPPAPEVRLVPADLQPVAVQEAQAPFVDKNGNPLSWQVYRIHDGGPPQPLYATRRYIRTLTLSSDGSTLTGSMASQAAQAPVPDDGLGTAIYGLVAFDLRQDPITVREVIAPRGSGPVASPADDQYVEYVHQTFCDPTSPRICRPDPAHPEVLGILVIQPGTGAVRLDGLGPLVRFDGWAHDGRHLIVEPEQPPAGIARQLYSVSLAGGPLRPVTSETVGLYKSGWLLGGSIGVVVLGGVPTLFNVDSGVKRALPQAPVYSKRSYAGLTTSGHAILAG